jgi:MerR family transcriptional regulator, light-induced transcriptional regulator
MPDNLQIAAEAIRQRQAELGELITTYQYARQPELWKPLGDPVRAKCLRDMGYHLTYLAEALQAGDPAIFIDYLVWVKVLFDGLEFREDVLPVTLECTRQAATSISGCSHRRQAS